MDNHLDDVSSSFLADRMATFAGMTLSHDPVESKHAAFWLDWFWSVLERMEGRDG